MSMSRPAESRREQRFHVEAQAVVYISERRL